VKLVIYKDYLHLFVGVMLCSRFNRHRRNYISRVMELQFFKILLHQKFLFRVTGHFQLTLQSSLLEKRSAYQLLQHGSEDLYLCDPSITFLDLMTVNYKIFQSAIFFKKPETNLEREWTCSNFAFAKTKTRTLFLFHSCFIL